MQQRQNGVSVIKDDGTEFAQNETLFRRILPYCDQWLKIETDKTVICITTKMKL